MTDANGGHDWAMPGTASEPSVGHVPDAPAPPAPRPPGAAVQPGEAAQYSAPSVVRAAAPATAAPTYRSWQPGIIPLRPMTFGEFLSVPFKAMRYNRAVVIGGPLLCVVAAMVLLAAALWLAFTDPSLALLSPTGQLSGIQTSTVVVAIAAFVALILADAIGSAIVAPGVARAALGERISIGAAFRTMWPRIGSLLLLWLLSTIAVGLALAPGVVAIVAGAQNGDDALVGLGVLAMFLLGIVVSLPVYIIAALARCVIVLERKGAIASVRRTLGVIKGRFWWSVLIIFVTGAIIGFVAGIFQQVLSFIGSIALIIGFNGAWLGAAVYVATIVLGTVISYVLTYSYMGSVYALVYIDARIRHEGFDLDLARAAEARRA